MKKIVSVQNLIILLKLVIILNEINLRQNQEGDLYDFLNVSNIKCNQSNYITSFTMKICGETEIKKSQFFAFTFSDTKNISHSVKCSILINNIKRVLNSNESLNSTDKTEENTTDNEVIDNPDLETHITYHSIPNINYNNSNVSVTDNYDLDLEKDNYNSSNKVTNDYSSDRDNNNSDIEVTDNFYSNIQGIHNYDSKVADKDESSIRIVDNYKSDINYNNTDNVYSDYEITDSDSDEQKIKDDLTYFISEANNQTEIAEIKTTIPNSELKTTMPTIESENINPRTEIEINSTTTELEINQ